MRGTCWHHSQTSSNRNIVPKKVAFARMPWTTRVLAVICLKSLQSWLNNHTDVASLKLHSLITMGSMGWMPKSEVPDWWLSWSFMDTTLPFWDLLGIKRKYNVIWHSYIFVYIVRMPHIKSLVVLVPSGATLWPLAAWNWFPIPPASGLTGHVISRYMES